jgi:tetratricopeptide (TPR) repeat protein
MEQGHALPSPEILPALHALGLDFLCEFLEVEVERHPENLAALGELGHLYTQTARYEKGLEIDRKLVALRPEDSTTNYNLACSLALLGETEEALDALDRAVALGYADLEHLLADEDLESLRETPRFRAIAQMLGTLGAAEGSPETPG